MSLFPLAAFDSIPLAEANAALERWAHKMGPMNRPDFGQSHAHGLIANGELVAVTVTAGLVREHVGGGLTHLTRDNTIELARVCAARRDLNRVVLRLWREFVFPALGRPFAISYQDAALHSGDLYRFDGWTRAGFAAAGGTDARSGRKGRDKAVWLWHGR